ncbi:FAD/NAD(P)-binding protein [Lignipirellula cremea]|uniref:FAD-containing monooxygenase MymA n=1 Tax=Lignipirellula cremea TaxID=2528010 RepID=A0A518DZJ8_9BACT|nr:FAD/NAD(P)-binding protein [Lignipirellula cremea]QDU97259.1 Putative FAD-containing monooxygenase MymA [Lignipirellula cremea]
MNGPSGISPEGSQRRRLAIIGGGSSGLVCLKYALHELPDWEIVCFEQSQRITGAWGNPYPGFVSTSTRYTTQFACFPCVGAEVDRDGGASRREFFREGEYGEYLTRFASAFGLTEKIRLGVCVERVVRPDSGSGWDLHFCAGADGVSPAPQHFDAVAICTGLVAEPQPFACDLPTLGAAELTLPQGLESIRNRQVVVVGGGESAVDFAWRLARADLQNQVYLSLKSGIRVSPRYHPIRGVPSDFLRNRLMLSIHPDLRNWIGQRFVEARIRYEEAFQRWFPHAAPTATASELALEDVREDGARESPVTAEVSAADAAVRVARRKDWTYRLTKAAKDDLFNMFHNKSDDFLQAVADERIRIVGPALDRTYQRFRAFDADEELAIPADLAVPAIGYRARLQELFQGAVKLTDFYLGCCHTTFPDLFLVGFARPVIGNIPSMSEMQARYVCGLLAGKFPRPENLPAVHAADLARRRRQFGQIDFDRIFAVEMFPYCDQLARMMGAWPTYRELGSLSAWARMQLSPATTMHYTGDLSGTVAPDAAREWQPVYMPALLVMFLLGLKPLDAVYRLFRR